MVYGWLSNILPAMQHSDWPVVRSQACLYDGLGHTLPALNIHRILNGNEYTQHTGCHTFDLTWESATKEDIYTSYQGHARQGCVWILDIPLEGVDRDTRCVRTHTYYHTLSLYNEEVGESATGEDIEEARVVSGHLQRAPDVHMSIVPCTMRRWRKSRVPRFAQHSTQCYQCNFSDCKQIMYRQEHRDLCIQEGHRLHIA